MADEKGKQEYQPDDISRILVLIYGFLQDGDPFWCYLAVKPSQYKTFEQAQKDNKIDLENFEPFGEIVVSGKGQVPPDEVTLKVAEMYKTDASKFFRPIDPEAEVAKEIEAFKKKMDSE